LSPSPVSALVSAQDIIARLAETPSAVNAFAEYLPAQVMPALKSSAWYAKALPAAVAPDMEAASSRSIEIGGIPFREVAGGGFVTGDAFLPRKVSLEDFYIAAAIVSPSSWEAFLAANPLWDLQHAAGLREQGLITEDYLVPFSGGPANAGISSVSWYAAEAYCEWLTGFLPSALSSYEVRLPTETEWEYAMRLLDEIRNPGGILWEWCKDLYAPLDIFPVPEEAAARIGSPERSLRGGSWINQAGSVNIATRASLPPRFCSPFVSFRPVIALKRGTVYE
jgi:formylglycine-generating enzyme required for sulfatase activity